GDRAVFGIEIPALARKRASVPMQVTGDLLIAVGADVGAQIALANFREAMRMPVDTGFFCFRAIEAVMQSMRADDNERDLRAWERLRQNLIVDRSAIGAVKAHADAPRHGRATSIGDRDRATVLLITDEIVERYLRFLAAGKTKPLDSNTFALLVDTPAPSPGLQPGSG